MIITGGVRRADWSSMTNETGPGSIPFVESVLYKVPPFLVCERATVLTLAERVQDNRGFPVGKLCRPFHPSFCPTHHRQYDKNKRPHYAY